MKKLFSLLKAVMSQDMDIFVFKAKKGASTRNKVIIPIFLYIMVMLSMGALYYPLAKELIEIDKLPVILTIAVIFPSILAIIEGVYKSQGVLFEAKDNDLLFSLPIPKKMILLSRAIKLYIFQFLYSMLFTLPGIIVYLNFAKEDAYFYFITAFMLLLFPIIPTVLGCFVGALIKRLSTKFKSPKIMQTVITFALFALIMAFSYNSNGILENIVQNAENLDTTLKTWYYPIKAYSELINQFNIITLIKLLLINAVVIFVFVLLISKSYFKVISDSRAVPKKNTKNKKITFKKKSPILALLQKEFSRYFASTIYMINTLFGLLLLLIATIGLCSNFDGALSYMSSGEISQADINTLYMLASKVYLAIIISMSFMTSITSSSISMEGKSFNISKSLPVTPEKVLLSKILMSNIITIPVIIICDIVFIFTFNVSILDFILIIISSFIAPSIAATFGLIVNLKYPKMNASSDAEIVKQSMSSMVAVFGGILLSGIFVVLTFIFAGLRRLCHDF